MNRVVSFFEKQHGISKDLSYDFALHRLCVHKGDNWKGIVPSSYSSDYNPEPPIFSAKFANCNNYKHILAIANEDGKIALQDTTKRNTDSEEQALSAPQCHYNAVFDLEWAPGQMKFVSASGDHTARLWDAEGSEIRACRTFNGHTRSVKTAAFRKSDSSVFATGGRDGAILIWDTRANLNLDLTSRADNCIYSGHSGGPGTPVSQKKKSRTPKLGQNTTSSSITGLAFQDSTTLISCGAGDGIIKVWDLRRNYTCYKREPLPKYSLPYAGTSTFKGFTNLLIDKSGAKLYANCMDNSIYCYNLFSYSTKPLKVYRGFRNSTFYIKSCLSPDENYLLSGSSDEKAYIWNLKKSEPLVALLGHTVEVTCVAWGSYGDMPIVTCSDDARHKIWRIGPDSKTREECHNMYRGHAEVCRTQKLGSNFLNNLRKCNLNELECTPKSLKRIVEQNERTPGTEEKVVSKRSFSEMIGDHSCYDLEKSGQKRIKIMEPRGRRLFSPTATPTARTVIIEENCEHESLASPIKYKPEDNNQENNYESNESNEFMNLPSTSACALAFMKVYSPLSERSSSSSNVSPLKESTPITSNSILSSVIYSPTSNLPNYVVDGDAPHLSVMSPKRKLKTKVDWLTKIRKQKLLTNRNISSEKIQDEKKSSISDFDVSCSTSYPKSPSLRMTTECSKLFVVDHKQTACDNLNETISPLPTQVNSTCLQNPSQRTPTSSRRITETSIRRFFITQQRNTREKNM